MNRTCSSTKIARKNRAHCFNSLWAFSSVSNGSQKWIRLPKSMTNHNWSKIPKNHTIEISSGRNIIFSSTGKLVAIVEFNPFSSMSEFDFNNLNKLSQFLFNQRRFLTKITINKTIKSGEMWAIGWRKSMTKGELYGLYGTTKNIQNHQAAWDDQKQDLDEAGKILANGFKKLANGLFDECHENFKKLGLPDFGSSSASNSVQPSSFASALTFTTKFSNYPHKDCDRGTSVAKGSWWTVNEQTGEIIKNLIGLIKGGHFGFPQEHLLINFSKCAGNCEIFWRAQDSFHYTLPSQDSGGVTQLGMSAQVSHKLVNLFEKIEKIEKNDLNNSNLYIRDDAYIAQLIK